jgi:hypothetical protein
MTLAMVANSGLPSPLSAVERRPAHADLLGEPRHIARTGDNTKALGNERSDELLDCLFGVEHLGRIEGRNLHCHALCLSTL